MNGTTRCPHCETRFRITEAQLISHHGQVRCGQCMSSFDARPHFTPEVIHTKSHQVTPKTLAERVMVFEDNTTATVVKHRIWLWIIGILIFLIVLIIQFSYFFRVNIATRLPALKPALVNACHFIACSVPLPQNATLIDIESSSLIAHPTQDNQVIFNALLHNRATYNLAFPTIALTLKNEQGKVIARRLFLPVEYLPADDSVQRGFLPNHEVDIKLQLNTSEFRPVGYLIELND